MASKAGKLTKKFGMKVKIERMKQNISQENLAANSNLSKTSLSAIETGKSTPTIETANDIANALNIPLKELIDVDKIDL